MGDQSINHPRVRRVGRRFERGGRAWWCRAVCYGPFPTSAGAGWLPGESDLRRDLDQMVKAGFNALRVFHPPTEALMAAAAERGLVVWGGLPWEWQADFTARPEILVAARAMVESAARQWSGHPALGGWVVANEIEPTLVRWIGRQKVRRTLEDLCGLVHRHDPDALAVYANFPPTEFLLPDNADVAGMNLYLEDETALRRYLRRAHHLAGELPLWISEFGIDRKKHGEENQTRWLERAFAIAEEEGAAGLCWFTWSDAWRDARSGGVVEGWKFGLTAEDGSPHPALDRAEKFLPNLNGGPVFSGPWPKASVLFCTRNGRIPLPRCLEALRKLDYPDFEVVVVDDGSEDGTGDWVKYHFPEVRLIQSRPIGLGAARNLAANAALGEILAFIDDDCEVDQAWLGWAVAGMEQGKWGVAGGPSLAPSGSQGIQRILDRLPGLAVQVMLDDQRAEHVPGCNVLVRAEVFRQLGGFDPRFRTAGDDVDFCWRAMEAGHCPGFLPMAVVWHHRRSTPWRSLRQQFGYGRAETQLAGKWTERVGPGGARWAGAVYGPGREAARVYRGPFGYGDYPALEMTFTSRPRPPIGTPAPLRWLHGILCTLQPWARALGRWKEGMAKPGWPEIRHGGTGGEVAAGANQLVGSFWHPDGQGRDVLLPAAIETWRASGCQVVADDGWQEHDLRVTPPPAPGAGTFTLTTVTEYTEKPGCLTRWRLIGPAASIGEAARTMRKLAVTLGFVAQEG